jgi:hypothetical protein
VPPIAVVEWLDALPFLLLVRVGLPLQVLLLGTVALLAATGNGIVRAVLQGAGTEFRRSEQRLRGGRLIGVLERLLVFALALAGEPTAAALVISAKSLLRFPELSRVARAEEDGSAIPEVDFVTEYFLLGSLTSWCIALLPALLFAR